MVTNDFILGFFFNYFSSVFWVYRFIGTPTAWHCLEKVCMSFDFKVAVIDTSCIIFHECLLIWFYLSLKYVLDVVKSHAQDACKGLSQTFSSDWK